MKKEEFLKTLKVCGKEIKLGLDDYGQCYYIEWEDENEQTQSTGLGTYNFNYMESIYHLFDEKYRNLSRKDLWGEKMTETELRDWKKYQKLFDEEYKWEHIE